MNPGMMFENGMQDQGKTAGIVFEKFGNFLDLMLECGQMDEDTRKKISGEHRHTAFLAFLGALAKIKIEHPYLGASLAKIRDDYYKEYQKGNEDGTEEIMVLSDRVMRTFERIVKDSWKFFKVIEFESSKFTPAQRCKACRYLCLFWDVVHSESLAERQLAEKIPSGPTTVQKLED